jgi:hypothetical protein
MDVGGGLPEMEESGAGVSDDAEAHAG